MRLSDCSSLFLFGLYLIYRFSFIGSMIRRCFLKQEGVDVMQNANPQAHPLIQSIELINIHDHHIIPVLEKLVEEDNKHEKYDLHNIAIKHCRLNEEECEAIAKLFSQCGSLEGVTLSDTHISTDYVIEILRGIRGKDLTSLDLSNNWLEMSDHTGTDFVHELEKHEKLSVLNFSIDWLHDVGVSLLAEHLNQNNIVSFDLSCNDFQLKGLAAISRYFQKHPVKHINISYNLICENGAHYLANMIHRNEHLLTLNACSNSIDDRGVSYIANALAENNHLTELDLSDNKINLEGILSLIQIASQHQSLCKLNLAHNMIAVETAQELKRTMNYSGKLELLI